MNRRPQVIEKTGKYETFQKEVSLNRTLYIEANPNNRALNLRQETVYNTETKLQMNSKQDVMIVMQVREECRFYTLIELGKQ